MIELISNGLLLAGALLFVTGSLGLLRMQGIFEQLHVLTKVDNIGVSLMLLGIWLKEPALLSGAKLLLIWVLVLTASTLSSMILAYLAHDRGTGS